jgi:hypothetical protein
MIRAIFKNGTIELLSSLPGDWRDGQELVIEKVTETDVTGDLERWSHEVDELARRVPIEEFERLDAALAEADRDAKDHVRRQMGLAG